MAKNIIVYSDGTGQDGGVRPEQRVSNIYKMFRTSRVSFENAIDPRLQVTMYDPGLGTDVGATAMTAPVRFLQKLLSSIDGRGITTNIVDCYTFLIDHYEPGDRIWLFGFSRGAYTARSVADLLRLCGVPTKTPKGPVPRFRAEARKIAEEATLTVLEHGAGHPRGHEQYEKERDELARRFREKYGADHPSGGEQRSNVAPYFVGVFDTVAALGASGGRRLGIQALIYGMLAVGGLIPAFVIGVIASLAFDFPFWSSFLVSEGIVLIAGVIWLGIKQRRDFKKTIRDYPKPGDKNTHKARWEGRYFNRLLSRYVCYARSANAIDETRADFDRVPWGPTRKMPEERDGVPTFKQFFFAGNHSDVGGSYAEVESRLSDIALAWMLEEALSVPGHLLVGPVFVNGEKMARTGDQGTPLFLYPADNGVEHCEVTATRDYLDSLKWPLRWLLRNQNYAVKVRELPEEAKVHPSVGRRLELNRVQQLAKGFGPYRPDALRPVVAYAHYFAPDESAGGEATARAEPGSPT